MLYFTISSFYTSHHFLEDHILTFVSTPRLNMNPVSFKSPTPERSAMGSITATAPHQPCTHHYPPAVVSFEFGGQVVALGNTNGQNQGEDIKVAFTTKHRGSALPYIGFRVKLKCAPRPRTHTENPKSFSNTTTTASIAHITQPMKRKKRNFLASWATTRHAEKTPTNST